MNSDGLIGSNSNRDSDLRKMPGASCRLRLSEILFEIMRRILIVHITINKGMNGIKGAKISLHRFNIKSSLWFRKEDDRKLSAGTPEIQ